jgi:GNAT superfamily N-acetyltransferase
MDPPTEPLRSSLEIVPGLPLHVALLVEEGQQDSSCRVPDPPDPPLSPAGVELGITPFSSLGRGTIGSQSASRRPYGTRTDANHRTSTSIGLSQSHFDGHRHPAMTETAGILDNLQQFAQEIAVAMGGDVRDSRHTKTYLNSEYEPFFNHVFVDATVAPTDAAACLEDRPGYVWLTKAPSSNEARSLEGDGFLVEEAVGMRASIQAQAFRRIAGTAIVGNGRQLDEWLAVYGEVFEADHRAHREWKTLYDRLGPGGSDHLLLFIAGPEEAAAIAACLFSESEVGLYCFGTRNDMREQGLASSLVEACHSEAGRRGITHGVLHATRMGHPVYRRAGYQDVGTICSLFSPDRHYRSTFQ